MSVVFCLSNGKYVLKCNRSTESKQGSYCISYNYDVFHVTKHLSILALSIAMCNIREKSTFLPSPLGHPIL